MKMATTPAEQRRWMQQRREAADSTLVRHSRLFEHLQTAQPPCAPTKSP
jgi:hypothetical protein